MSSTISLRFVTLSALAGILIALVVFFFTPKHMMPEALVSTTNLFTVSERAPKRDSAFTRASYSKAVKMAGPAVVDVFVTRWVQRPAPQELSPELAPATLQTNQGSAIILNKKGYLLTNHHVVKGASEVLVRLSNGEELQAKLVGADPHTDLAVLHIQSETPLIPIVLGNDRTLEVGDVVLAIGNPFGMGQTVTQGIVSAVGRRLDSMLLLEDFIQTDAAINPGNSGGALVNPAGELVGINTAIIPSSATQTVQGISFAIPARVILRIVEQIIEKGKVIRGWLGVRIAGPGQMVKKVVTPEGRPGIIVTWVYHGSPAAEADMRQGDVLLSIDGLEQTDVQALIEATSNREPGNQIEIEIWREGAIRTLYATLRERP